MNVNTGEISQIPDGQVGTPEQTPLTATEAGVLQHIPLEARVKELCILRAIERLNVKGLEKKRARFFIGIGYDFAMETHKFQALKKTDPAPQNPQAAVDDAIKANFQDKGGAQ
jgi:hypothetical protein